MRIGVLNNLRAGRSAGCTAAVLRVLDRHPEVLHVETSNGEVVPEALAEFAREGVELLVVNGGDGTVQHVLTELLTPARRDWMPMIAPIRGGRTNMTAIDLGCRRDATRGLTELLDAARAGGIEDRIHERAVLHADLGDQTKFGMFFGAGMLHRAIQLAHKTVPEDRSHGLAGVGLVMATLVGRAAAGRHVGVLTPDKMQIALDHTPLEPEEFTLVMATSLDRLFFGIRPFWGSGPAPVRVTTVASRANGLARAVPGMLRGKPPAHVTPEAGYTSRNVDQAAFRIDCGLTIDGELFAPEPGRLVQIRGDERVRFVRA